MESKNRWERIAVKKQKRTIETDSLLLRIFERSDAKEFYLNCMSDQAVAKYVKGAHHKDISETKRLVRILVKGRAKSNNIYAVFAIVEKRSGRLIGAIEAVYYDESIKRVAVGYKLGSKWWGKGYATEALRAMIAYLFEGSAVNRIEAIHDVENAASGRVMQKAGMVYEGAHRQSVKNNRGIVDVKTYSILRDEFLNSNRV